jgi:hypothetical protein
MKRILLSIILLALCCFGCGGQPKLKGSVVFSDDQSPLPCGTVMFDDGKVTAHGNIKEDGTFTVGSLKENDGLPAGSYKVAIVGAYKLLPCPQNEDDDPKNDIYPPPQEQLIDKKYESYETSQLTVTVEKSNKSLNISVDRFASRP